MSTAQFTTPLIQVIPGQIISASLWNNEFNSLFTNLNPSGLGAYSDTDPQMQTATDPFPTGTSRPTSLAGELERIRYILNLIIGQTYWYQHPVSDISTMNAAIAAVIPSGTVMPFYQAAAPVGWTQVVTQNDKALRVVSGAGGGSGGSVAFSSSLAHSHTVASHTHPIGVHTHTMGNHTHNTPAHVHTLVNGSTAGVEGSVQIDIPVHVASAGGAMNASSWVGDGTHTLRQVSATTNSGAGAGTSAAPSNNNTDGPTADPTGSTAPGTDSQLGAFAYIDVILASKN